MNNFKTTYQGDPKIFIDENGAYLKFIGGQPIMDQGVENAGTIQLMTKKGWVGNQFLTDAQQIGSDFIEVSEKSITLTNLEDRRREANLALEKPFFGEKQITVENSVNYRVDTNIIVKSPNSDSGILNLSNNGENWVSQKINPAYKR